MNRFSRKFNKVSERLHLVIITILFLVSILFTPVMAQISTPNSFLLSQQNGIQLVQQAQENYENFDFQLAIEYLQRAVTIFDRQRDNLNKAMAMSNLALIFQQLGEGEKAKKEIKQSLDILDQLEATKEQQRILAQALDIQGKIAHNLGHFEDALTSWEEAVNIYKSLGEKDKIFQNEINQAHILQDLGFYSRSCTLLINSLDLEVEDNNDESKKSSNFNQCKVKPTQINTLTENILKSTDFQKQKSTQRALRSLANVLAFSSKNEDTNTNTYGNAEQLLRASYTISNSWLKLSEDNFPDCRACLPDDINSEKDNDNNENLQLDSKNDINKINLIAFKYSSYQKNIALIENNKTLLNLANLIAGFNTNKLQVARKKLKKDHNDQQAEQDKNKAKKCLIKTLETIYKIIENNNSKIDNNYVNLQRNVKIKLSKLAISINISDEDETNEKLRTLENWQEPQDLAEEIYQSFTNNNLGINRELIYSKISLANNLVCLNINAGSPNCLNQSESPLYNPVFVNNQVSNQVINLLENTIIEAEQIDDKRALSNANGSLGRFYEYLRQWDSAEQFTNTALGYARLIEADDLIYQWDWQLGRILLEKGNMEKAIAFYENSINSLQKIRGDLVSLSRDVQFNFRDQVEPVYRRTVDLLIQSADLFPEKAQERLKKAREVIEQLQLAELENFFREACIKTNEESLDKIINNLDQNTAIIYPIILEDRLEIILSLPSQPLTHYKTLKNEQEIEDAINDILDKPLSNVHTKKALLDFQAQSEEIYNWLIKPWESSLNSNINNLVFVLDGILQKMPMGILYDGEKYLIEKYNIGESLGLTLLDSEPLKNQGFNILAVGISEAVQGFDPLPNVKQEIEDLKKDNLGSTSILLDESFTKSKFKQRLESPFQIVHIATHGEFNSSYEKTFILTYDDKINAKELDQFLTVNNSQKQPIELLVLSACETAKGDKRAALGLAGVAVKSGASSTIASLWKIQDESTAIIMADFYKNLTNSPTPLSKVKALREAQLKMLRGKEYDHPFYWGAFVLVGNWL